MGLGQNMSGKEKAIKAAKAFEFYVKYLWPMHKKIALKQISRRCNNCAASEKMIKLGDDGICSLCASSLKLKSSDLLQHADIKEEEKKVFESILKENEGAGLGNYDALILYSGGKDSSYLVRRIKNEFPKLRILTFTIDNSFMSPVAKENIEYLIPKLQVDHIFLRPRKEFYIKLFKYAITHLNEEGCYGTVDFSDGEFMLDSARKLAAEKKIPLILCGYSKFQVQNGLKLQHFESPREVELADRTQTAGLLLNKIFDEQEIQQWWKASKWPQEQISRLLFPLYCWDLEEAEIINKVTEWGLVSPKKYSPIVTNHQLIPLLGVVDVHRFGYSSFEKEFCRMIREGKADKEHWQKVFEFLEYTSRTGLFVKQTVLDSLEQLGLTLKDVGIKFK